MAFCKPASTRKGPLKRSRMDQNDIATITAMSTEEFSQFLSPSQENWWLGFSGFLILGKARLFFEDWNKWRVAMSQNMLVT